MAKRNVDCTLKTIDQSTTLMSEHRKLELQRMASRYSQNLLTCHHRNAKSLSPERSQDSVRYSQKEARLRKALKMKIVEKDQKIMRAPKYQKHPIQAKI